MNFRCKRTLACVCRSCSKFFLTQQCSNHPCKQDYREFWWGFGAEMFRPKSNDNDTNDEGILKKCFDTMHSNLDNLSDKLVLFGKSLFIRDFLDCARPLKQWTTESGTVRGSTTRTSRGGLSCFVGTDKMNLSFSRFALDSHFIAMIMRMATRKDAFRLLAGYFIRDWCLFLQEY
jgi:hypothetical protein